MNALGFIKKHAEDIFCILAAVALCSLVAAFIVAFRSGMLPYSPHGDAFDTIYAIEGSDAQEASRG